jgi:hypothetical protein
MIAASSWSTIVDVAAGVVGVIVLGLLRAVYSLGERVARLEATVASTRPSDRSRGSP